MPAKDIKADGTINLRNLDESGFEVEHIGEHHAEGRKEEAPLAAVHHANVASKPKDKVLVKFEKFVNLVATHAYEEVFEKHKDEDVIISTNLLTDLANAHEEDVSDKKVPTVFVVGITLGIIVTWFILKG